MALPSGGDGGHRLSWGGAMTFTTFKKRERTLKNSTAFGSGIEMFVFLFVQHPFSVIYLAHGYMEPSGPLWPLTAGLMSWNEIQHHLKKGWHQRYIVKPNLPVWHWGVSWGFAESGTCLFRAWEQSGCVWERKQAVHCCCTSQLAVSCADKKSGPDHTEAFCGCCFILFLLY